MITQVSSSVRFQRNMGTKNFAHGSVPQITCLLFCDPKCQINALQKNPNQKENYSLHLCKKVTLSNFHKIEQVIKLKSFWAPSNDTIRLPHLKSRWCKAVRCCSIRGCTQSLVHGWKGNWEVLLKEATNIFPVLLQKMIKMSYCQNALIYFVWNNKLLNLLAKGIILTKNFAVAILPVGCLDVAMYCFIDESKLRKVSGDIFLMNFILILRLHINHSFFKVFSHVHGQVSSNSWIVESCLPFYGDTITTVKKRGHDHACLDNGVVAVVIDMASMIYGMIIVWSPCSEWFMQDHGMSFMFSVPSWKWDKAKDKAFLHEVFLLKITGQIFLEKCTNSTLLTSCSGQI